MAKRKKLIRDVITPTIDLATAGEFVETGDKLTYWKQILPETDAFEYVDDEGNTHHLDFSHESNQELIDAYNDGTMAQLPLMLADKDNAHTMDPERYRADVVKLRQARDGESPGVYAGVKFPSKKLAKSVLNNPMLGVSARIRPGQFVGSSGRKYSRKLIHVLGTLDPKATGMSGWTPAVDLSVYDSNHTVLDLSGTTYAEVSEVPKIKRDGKIVTPSDLAAMSADELESAQFTEAEIAQLVKGMDDDTLAEFVASAADEFEPGDDNDETDDDVETDDDDVDDDVDADDDVDDDVDADVVVVVGEPVGASLSNSGRRDVDLANSRAEAAQQTARRALKKAAESEAKAQRTALLSKGIPPWAVDLATPALVGDDDLVIDLSNHGGEKRVNASQVIRGLLEGFEGTVDLSDIDLGHGDADGEDQFADVRAALANIDI